MASLHAAALTMLACALASPQAHGNVSISNKPTHDVSCDAGVCTAAAPKAVLNVGEFQSMLDSGDVAVKTGSVAKDIEIAQPLAWTSTSRLTLEAQRSITVKKQVTVAATGAVTFTYAASDPDGDLMFANKGKIDFWDLARSFIVNGENYLLVGDIATLTNDVIANKRGFFALAKDYDASADGVYGMSPITAFNGKFEGVGHTIAGLKIRSREKYVGLFGTLRKAAVVRDITLADASIQVERHVGGALAGQTGGTILHASVSAMIGGANGGVLPGTNYGTVKWTNASGNVTIHATAGGMVSYNRGTILFSGSRASVYGGVAGGLVGYNAGLIQDSSAAGEVRKFAAGGVGGGLVGQFYSGSIVRGSATGAVFGNKDGDRLGGLVGWSTGSEIVQSFAAGDVEGVNATVGALVGDNSGTPIAQSYATGGVTGEFRAGGLLGYNRGALEQVYSIGSVAGAKQSGGLVGYEENNATAAHAYWDIDTSRLSEGCGTGNCSGITGLSDAQMKSGLPDGFDPNIWGSDPNINNGYPYLLANPPR